jgi:hypothetical protein
MLHVHSKSVQLTDGRVQEAVTLSLYIRVEWTGIFRTIPARLHLVRARRESSIGKTIPEVGLRA